MMKDLISRKNAIEALTVEDPGCGLDACRIVEQLPTLCEWTSCNKPPKVRTDVLLKFPNNLAIGFYDLGIWNVCAGNGHYIKISDNETQPIEWLPLNIFEQI